MDVHVRCYLNHRLHCEVTHKLALVESSRDCIEEDDRGYFREHLVGVEDTRLIQHSCKLRGLGEEPLDCFEKIAHLYFYWLFSRLS